MPTKFEKFLPIAGVLAGLLYIVFAVCGGSPPGTDKDAGTQVDWYNAHQGRVLISVVAGGLFLVAMGFFATGIRQALRSGEPGESTYSSVAYAGALLVGVAITLSAWVSFASEEAAHKHQGAAVHTLAYMGDSSWLPWTAASAVMMLGAGLGGLRTAALPKWLAIVTIALGVLNIAGPGGIVVFFVTPFWLILTGLVLLRRVSSSSSVAPTPTYAGVAA